MRAQAARRHARGRCRRRRRRGAGAARLAGAGGRRHARRHPRLDRPGAARRGRGDQGPGARPRRWTSSTAAGHDRSSTAASTPACTSSRPSELPAAQGQRPQARQACRPRPTAGRCWCWCTAPSSTPSAPSASCGRSTRRRVRALFAHYGGRVYALDHPTLGASPIANALTLVRALPQGRAAAPADPFARRPGGRGAGAGLRRRAAGERRLALLRRAPTYAQHRDDLQALVERGAGQGPPGRARGARRLPGARHAAGAASGSTPTCRC